MRYEQLHNVLHHLAPAYHRTVSDYYQKLADGDVSPRIRLMLDYLIDHEQGRALALGEYCREAYSPIQDHWIKGLEINFPEARPEELGAEAATDLDKLVKAAVSYKKTLIDYFSHLLEPCTERAPCNPSPTLQNPGREGNETDDKALPRAGRSIIYGDFKTSPPKRGILCVRLFDSIAFTWAKGIRPRVSQTEQFSLRENYPTD